MINEATIKPLEPGSIFCAADCPHLRDGRCYLIPRRNRAGQTLRKVKPTATAGQRFGRSLTCIRRVPADLLSSRVAPIEAWRARGPLAGWLEDDGIAELAHTIGTSADRALGLVRGRVGDLPIAAALKLVTYGSENLAPDSQVAQEAASDLIRSYAAWLADKPR